jgi:hypothetical protein
MPRATSQTLTPLERARKAKARIFGDDLADIMVAVAKARAAGDDAKIERLLTRVRPDSPEPTRKRRIENVLMHSKELVRFFKSSRKRK